VLEVNFKQKRSEIVKINKNMWKKMLAGLVLMPSLAFAGNYMYLNGSTAAQSVMVPQNSSNTGAMIASPVKVDSSGNMTGIQNITATGLLDVNTILANGVTSTGTLTATLGNITATNGNLVLGTAGNKLEIPTVADASVGTCTLVAGTCTVSTTAVTANSIIILTRESIGATGAAATGNLVVGTVVADTSFVVNSVQPADATALQATDVSDVGYEIIN